MFESTYIPVIISAFITPNPATAGQTVLISVAAADIECVPSVQVITAGEFTSGEM